MIQISTVLYCMNPGCVYELGPETYSDLHFYMWNQRLLTDINYPSDSCESETALMI